MEMKKNGKHILVSSPRKCLKGHYQSLCPLRSQESKSTEGRIPRKTRRKRRTLKKKSLSLEEEKYIQFERMPITLVEYLPNEFLQNQSEDEMKEEVVQCYMVSIDDNEREVDEVTLLLGQH